MSSPSTGGIDQFVNDVHQGDAAEVLRGMPANSVHMAMCSPPYYGLRDYGVDGQIGLEDSLDEYIEELLEVASELRRVLRDDGSWWLNLGDSFAGSWGAQSKDDEANHRDRDTYPGKNPARSGTIRRKSKMLIPHRVAIALEDAGWVVRADCPWVKPNPMPHPVKDRLHEHKEFVFHLTPEPDYWFDLDAIREPHKETSLNREASCFHSSGSQSQASPNEQRQREGVVMDAEDALHPNGKNPGDVLEIPVKAFPEAHFAVYPPELCETPIKSSCPQTVCAVCGTPYERDVDEIPVWERDRTDIEREQLKKALERYDESDLTEEHLEAVRRVGFNDAGYTEVHQVGLGKAGEDAEILAREAKDVLGGYFREITLTAHETAGWSQSCDCPVVGDYTEPGIVLDPFAGAGTTCLVAKRLGRRFVGIELNEEYVAMAQKRIGIDVDQPELLLDDGQTTLVQTDGGTEDRSQDADTDQSDDLDRGDGIETDGGVSQSTGDIYRDDGNYDKCKWERAWGEFNAALHATADAHGFLENIGEDVDSGEKAMFQVFVETFDEIAEKHNIESYEECWNGEIEECDDHSVDQDTDQSEGGEPDADN